MGRTIEAALDNPSLQNQRRFPPEYQFTLGGLETPITIRLRESLGEERVYFKQSHFIKTPVNPADPYKTSTSYGGDEGDALHRAIMTLAAHYQLAVGRGHTPKESWLVPNEDF